MLGLGLAVREGKSDATDGRRGSGRWPIRARVSCTQGPKAVVVFPSVADFGYGSWCHGNPRQHDWTKAGPTVVPRAIEERRWVALSPSHTRAHRIGCVAWALVSAPVASVDAACLFLSTEICP